MWRAGAPRPSDAPPLSTPSRGRMAIPTLADQSDRVDRAGDPGPLRKRKSGPARRSNSRRPDERFPRLAFRLLVAELALSTLGAEHNHRWRLIVRPHRPPARRSELARPGAVLALQHGLHFDRGLARSGR